MRTEDSYYKSRAFGVDFFNIKIWLGSQCVDGVREFVWPSKRDTIFYQSTSISKKATAIFLICIHIENIDNILDFSAVRFIIIVV